MAAVSDRSYLTANSDGTSLGLWKIVGRRERWVITDFASYVTIGIDVNQTTRVYLGTSADGTVLTLWKDATAFDQQWVITDSGSNITIHKHSASAAPATSRVYLSVALGAVRLTTGAAVGVEEQWTYNCTVPAPCWQTAEELPVSIQLNVDSAVQNRVYLSATDDGTQVNMWLTQTTDQYWLMKNQGDNYTIQLFSSTGIPTRSYLAASDDGTLLTLVETSVETPGVSVRWIVEEHSGNPNYHYTTISAANTSLQDRVYLGAGDSGGDGTQVDLWSSGGADQRWNINCPLAPSSYSYMGAYMIGDGGAGHSYFARCHFTPSQAPSSRLACEAKCDAATNCIAYSYTVGARAAAGLYCVLYIPGVPLTTTSDFTDCSSVGAAGATYVPGDSDKTVSVLGSCADLKIETSYYSDYVSYRKC